MKYAYYPGCSLHSTASEYGQSTEALCHRLGVELAEIPAWNCCGASSAHTRSHLLSLALPARNLALAEEMGLDIVAPCAACYNRFATTRHALAGDEVLRARVNRAIEMNYRARGRVVSLLELIVNDYGLDRLSREVSRPLRGLKVAAYYGCLLVRPPEATGFDDPEDPQSMDRLVEALGGQAVPWAYKTECCGSSFSATVPGVVLKLVNDILATARAAGAECLVTACPLCQANLDMRQAAVEKQYHTVYGLPVYYFTQLAGLALGLDPGRLGIRHHLVESMGLLVAKNLA